MAITFVGSTEELVSNDVTPITRTFDIGTRTNGLLIVCVLTIDTQTHTLASPTWNGVAMSAGPTRIRETVSMIFQRCSMFYLSNPANGSNVFSVNYSDSVSDTANVSYVAPLWVDGAHQTTASVLDQSTDGEGSTDPSLALTPGENGELLVMMYASEANVELAVGSGETLVQSVDNGTRVCGISYAIQTTATTQTMDWTGADDVWVAIAASFKEAASSNVTVDANLGTLVITELSATISASGTANITANTGALSLVGLDATVSATGAANITANLGTLTLTGLAATVTVSGVPLDDSLVAYYSLSDLTDDVGALDLTNNNSATFVTGKVSNAANFVAASTQYLSRADNAALDMGDIDFTITCWVNLASKSAQMGILNKFVPTGDQRGYQLQWMNTVDRFRTNISVDGTSGTLTALDANTFGAPSTSTWYFIALRYDATNNLVSLSVNAGTPDTASVTGGAFANTAPFEIGRLAGTAYWNGQIDEVGIWKRLLDDAEIVDLYNSGNGRNYNYIVGIADVTVDANIGALTLTGLDATVSATGTAPIAASVGALTLVGLDATVTPSGTAPIAANIGALTLAGLPATLADTPPVVVLDTADLSTLTATPTLAFTGTASSDEDIRYQIQISTDPAFDDAVFVGDSVEYLSSPVGGLHPNPLPTGTTHLGDRRIDDRFGATFTGADGVLHKASIAIGMDETLVDGTALVRVYYSEGTPGTDATPANPAAAADCPTPGWLAQSESIEIVYPAGPTGWLEFEFTGANRIWLTDATEYMLIVDWRPTSAVYENTIELSYEAPPPAGYNGYVDGNHTANHGVRTDFVPYYGILEQAHQLDKLSGTDSGFSGTPDSTDPFASAQQVTFTVQVGDALFSDLTYYWRVRGIDPDGTNTFGSWSEVREFTVNSDTEVNADLGTLTLTGLDATVSASGAATIAASLGTLTITELAATVTPTGAASIVANLGALTITELAATVAVSGNATIAAAVGVLSLAGQSATVSGSGAATVNANLGTLSLVGLAATVSSPTGPIVNVALGALQLAGLQAAVAISGTANIVANPGTLNLTGLSATVAATGGASIAATVGQLTLTGLAATVTLSGAIIHANVGTLTLVGLQATVSATGEVSIQVSIGLLILVGLQASILVGEPIIPTRRILMMAARNRVFVVPAKSRTFSIE